MIIGRESTECDPGRPIHNYTSIPETFNSSFVACAVAAIKSHSSVRPARVG